MKGRKLLLAAVFTVAFAVPAMADSVGIAGVVDVVKGPPLATGESAVVPWDVHLSEDMTNYAGLLINLEFDTHEVAQLTITPAGAHGSVQHGAQFPGPLVIPGSASTPDLLLVPGIAMWVPEAEQSGILLPASQVMPVFDLEYIAKRTSPINNSDVDIIVHPWIIQHVAVTDQYQVKASDWVYVTALGELCATPGAGLWSHFTATVTTTIPASAFIATNFISSAAVYGIEHVPEPVAMTFLVGGAVSLLTARRRGKKRG